MDAPPIPSAMVFIDGQNLFRTVKNAFGYHFPNYDVSALAAQACQKFGWRVEQTRFYTGIPEANRNPESDRWHHFWCAKLNAMKRQGVEVYSRPLKYHQQEIVCPNGQSMVIDSAREKGIDIRIALDIIRGAYEQRFDVAVIFSQDQDFSEVAQEFRTIQKNQGRWIKLACVFPDHPSGRARGVNGTDWIRLSKTDYDLCLDPVDYRPKSIAPAKSAE